MKHYIYAIPDYEHSGDIQWAIGELLKICPKCNILKSYEERDYEAEDDYSREYGECDESIYQGYVEFEVPEEYCDVIEDFIY